jgi:hypothetical protein
MTKIEESASAHNIYSVFRIPYSVFRISYFVFRISYFVNPLELE